MDNNNSCIHVCACGDYQVSTGSWTSPRMYPAPSFFCFDCLSCFIVAFTVLGKNNLQHGREQRNKRLQDLQRARRNFPHRHQLSAGVHVVLRKFTLDLKSGNLQLTMDGTSTTCLKHKRKHEHKHTLWLTVRETPQKGSKLNFSVKQVNRGKSFSQLRPCRGGPGFKPVALCCVSFSIFISSI